MVAMSRLTRQVVSLIIAVLLVLSPLQGMTMNAMPASADAAMGMQHQMSGGQSAMDVTMSMADMDGMMQMASTVDQSCEQCDTSTCCAGAQCLSGHCATCAAGLMAIISVSSEAVAQAVILPVASAHLPQVSDNLFRPPRV